MKQTLPLLCLMTALPQIGSAEETRSLEAHVHGVGALNVAVEGDVVAMEFRAPGADIVGFEHAAKSDADLAAVEAALKVLEKPFDLFIFPEGAGCAVTEAKAELVTEEDHDDHDHEKHEDHDDHAEHKHDDHAEHKHDGHDDHAEDKHDDHDDHAEHKHDDHDDHAEDKHGDHDHAGEAAHSAFHAEYMLTCSSVAAIDAVDFAYFDQFENAREVVVQIVTGSGAMSFEVMRAQPRLDLTSVN